MNSLKTAMLAIGLNSCILFGADFFPLQEGNTWTYREARTGQTFSVKVGPPATVAGNLYYKLTGYVGTDLLVRVEDVHGALVYWDEARAQEILLTSFEPFEGGYWSAPLRPCPEQDGQTQVKRANHDGPAGPVPGVLEIRYRTIGCADIGTVEEQYAGHLGMLRRVETSFAGPRIFDLVSARIGNLTIDAPPAGRFSVSARLPAAGPATATFRLQVTSPVTLPFSSGQEYDFVLRDSAGNPLWRWSTGILFVQSVHTRAVADEWSVTVEIPDRGFQPGDYTIEAAVATSGSSPFAATAPVRIAPKEEPAADTRPGLRGRHPISQQQ